MSVRHSVDIAYRKNSSGLRWWCDRQVQLSGDVLIVTWTQKLIIARVNVHLDALGQMRARCCTLFRQIVPRDRVSPEIFEHDLRVLRHILLHWVSFLTTRLKTTFLDAYLIDIVVAVWHDILLVQVDTLCINLLAAEESLAFFLRIVANAHYPLKLSFMRINWLLPMNTIGDTGGAQRIRAITWVTLIRNNLIAVLFVKMLL